LGPSRRHSLDPPPSVSIVFLVYNRKEELRESLRQMLQESDYDQQALEVIVVDNASSDGSSQMVREEFPGVQLIRREENVGVSGWNDGFAVARGDYVLALDDDCYLPDDGLRRAVELAQAEDADLVSFGVRALDDPGFRFTETIYRTGLLAFWGCAVLIRRPVLERLKGYDPEIFVWANEMEFMLRFFDQGFRHLHAPDILAVHMKETGGTFDWSDYVRSKGYRLNRRHFAYIAAKSLRPRHAAGALIALLTEVLRDGLRRDSAALGALPGCVKGFVHGLRFRAPVANPDISAVYRRNFHSYASPWWISRPIGQLVRATPRELTLKILGRPYAEPPSRWAEYYEERAEYYPPSRATLEF
jgi:GT2 family glycosyltransferase